MKKTIALILGVLMLMGCLSVSAAPSKLGVEVADPYAEYAFRPGYELSAQTSLLNGATYDEETATITSSSSEKSSGVRVYFNADKSSITADRTVVIEYKIKTNLSAWGSSSDATLLCQTGSSLTDIRLYRGAPAYIRDVASGTIHYFGNTSRNDTISYDMRIEYNVVTDTLNAWIDGGEFIVNSSARSGYYKDNISTITLMAGDQAAVPFELSNFRWYYKDTTLVSGRPVIGEEIYRHTFDAAAIDTSMVDVIGSNVTAKQENGKLSLSCPTSLQGEQTYIYFQKNKEKLTGQYVVEVVFKNPSYYQDQYHRLTFGNNTYYLNWSPKEYQHPDSYAKIKEMFSYRHGSTLNSPNWSSRMGEFNASNNNTLKLTHLYDTNAGTVDVWVNDVYAGKITSEHGLTAAMTSLDYININLYYGSIEIEDLRVYRPATFDAETGLSITEDANSVKIATNAAKDGRLYFATYTGEGDAKTVSALGSAALSLAPGKIYTISKADWEGAKAFFWNNNQQPIVDAWDLQ